MHRLSPRVANLSILCIDIIQKMVDRHIVRLPHTCRDTDGELMCLMGGEI
jgi:hypothetical protein